MKRTAIAFALLLTACGGAQDDGNTTPTRPGQIVVDESAPDEEKLVTLVEGLADHVSVAGGDCSAVSSAMSSWIDNHSARVADLSKNVEASNSGVPNAKIDELDARLDRAWDAVFASAKTCQAETQGPVDRLNAMFGI